jgi:hypothetical protein
LRGIGVDENGERGFIMEIEENLSELRKNREEVKFLILLKL